MIKLKQDITYYQLFCIRKNLGAFLNEEASNAIMNLKIIGDDFYFNINPSPDSDKLSKLQEIASNTTNCLILDMNYPVVYVDNKGVNNIETCLSSDYLISMYHHIDLPDYKFTIKGFKLFINLEDIEDYEKVYNEVRNIILRQYVQMINLNMICIQDIDKIENWKLVKIDDCLHRFIEPCNHINSIIEYIKGNNKYIRIDEDLNKYYSDIYLGGFDAYIYSNKTLIIIEDIDEYNKFNQIISS